VIGGRRVAVAAADPVDADEESPGKQEVYPFLAAFFFLDDS